jgi:hypothetical protein
MKHARILSCTLAIAFIPGWVLACATVSGPIIWQGACMGPESIARYILSVGLVCIGMEAAIYRYLPRFKRPFYDSILSNAVSTVLGIPLTFLCIAFGDPIIVPTLASIAIEGVIIYAIEKPTRTKDGKSVFWPVVWANVLSNAMILALISWNLERI